MIRAAIRLILACLIVYAPAAAAWAQPHGASMAKVSGWIGSSSSIPVYTSDGTPRGRQDLSRVTVAGLRQWDPGYNLVKLSPDPADDRWVPAKHLNLVFCESAPQAPSLSGAGRPQNNKAISYGSGGKCE
jgi:hypothetical protein